MRPQTVAAIKTLLLLDPTVTPDMRRAVVTAMLGDCGDKPVDMCITTAARYLSISRITLWRWCKEKRVRYVKRGKKFFIPGDVIERLKKGDDA